MRTLVVSVMAVALSAAAMAQGPADLVLENGRVLTPHVAGAASAEAVAVKAGRIVYVGDRAGLAAWVGPATKRLDLAGQLVLPGLVDAHVHVEGMGTARDALNLVGATSLDEALARVAAKAAEVPAGEWILGRGWDQNDWPGKTFPTAADLDRVAPKHPVMLTRVDGHATWVNSKALAMAAVTKATADPGGGRVMRDAAGAPTGVLIDAASDLVGRHVPPPTREQRKRRLRAGLEVAARGGLTAVHDAGVDLEAVALYEELLKEGPLPARVHVMLRGDAFVAAGPGLQPRHGLGDGQLSVRAIKAMADGALGSRGAWLLAPYSDEPGTRGLPMLKPEPFKALLKDALARGFQVNTHAIGDAANRFVLDSYAEAFGPGGGAPHRFRVEHAQILDPADVPRFAALGVVPSMQPTHCTSDMYWAGARIGPEREKYAYLWKTFREHGVRVAFGSDAPVEAVDVIPGLHASVTRQDAKGWPEGGWHPKERLGFAEAVLAFSRDAAWAGFDEKDTGTIEVGKRADFTVLDKDVSSGRDVLSAKVSMTIVGGRVVAR
ncbi:MAG: amidohydrolase [Vicinamibacteria bacterium]|nr:amidohydrolase [Vicinamibacteria bacterium]